MRAGVVRLKKVPGIGHCPTSRRSTSRGQRCQILKKIDVKLMTATGSAIAMPTASAQQVATRGATALARLATRAVRMPALWQELLLLATVVAFTIGATVLVMVALGR